ncbi:MAG TPA: SDR family NAD(P)-dependent oxidoreductase, partial [Verrucomicrobia bacterium]|nr:SDR family NAD(P)-dependent oxidoreductase [Verrucomicrobiota bacterium]
MSLDPIDFSDLKNKTAVITGGAGVLCTSFAEALASVGANLALLDLNEEAAVELAGRLQAETGVQTIGIQADVLSEESLVVAREIIHSELGSVDILV